MLIPDNPRQTFLEAYEALKADMPDGSETYLNTLDPFVNAMTEEALAIYSISALMPGPTAQSREFMDYLPSLFDPSRRRHIEIANDYRTELQRLLHQNHTPIVEYIGPSVLRRLPYDVRTAQIKHMVSLNEDPASPHKFRAVGQTLRRRDSRIALVTARGLGVYREFVPKGGTVKNTFDRIGSPALRGCAVRLAELDCKALSPEDSNEYWCGTLVYGSME